MVYCWCPCKTSHLTRFVWTDMGSPSASQWIQWICQQQKRKARWFYSVSLMSMQDFTPDKVCMNRSENIFAQTWMICTCITVQYYTSKLVFRTSSTCHPLQMCCCRMAACKNHLSLDPKSDKSKSLFPRHQKEREVRKLHSTLLTLFYMWGWCRWCRRCQNLHRPGAGWAWMECCVQPAEFRPPSPPAPHCSCPPQQPCPETQQTGLNLFTANKFALLMLFTSRNSLEKRLSWPNMLHFLELCCRLEQLRSWNSNRKLSGILQADLLKTFCQWHHMTSYGHERVTGLAYLGK